jgi:spore germination cell wall hydrolase CwlJ-like protein
MLTSLALVCLTMNVYWEARNQDIAGQLAVAQVTSWYWDGKSDIPREEKAWETAMIVADAAMHGSGHAELQGVTHYHAVYSQPYWKDYMTKVTQIGDHIFYVN